MNSSGTNAVKTTAERSNLRNLVQIGMLGGGFRCVDDV